MAEFTPVCRVSGSWGSEADVGGLTLSGRVRCRVLISVLVVSTALSGVSALPGVASAAEAERPQVSYTKSVTGGTPITSTPARLTDAAGRSAGAPITSWPTTASASIALSKPITDGRDRTAASPRTRAYAPGTPVWAATDSGGVTPGAVDVRVLGRDLAAKAGIDGVLVAATPSAAVKDAVTVGVDYAGFDSAAGGGFGARLRLVGLPACALSTPEVPSCRVQTPLAHANEAASKSVTTTVNKPTVFALTSGASSSSGAGSFTATSLSPEGSWTGGTQSGSFTYQYPIPVPPAASTLVPTVSLSYDSGSVDGKTAATQAQASWVGDGWASPSSFIERSYVSCSSSPGGTPSPVSTEDRCYAGEILTMSLKGATTSLVWDAAQGVYASASEPGTVVTRVTGSGNGSGTYNTEYWKVTDQSGTVFLFGRNQLPGWSAGKPLTNSVDSTPVFSSHPGEPCYNAAGFASSVCTMGYRWNLDYVVDVHQNAMSYYYKQDTNFYGQNNGAANVPYVRDSHLDRIDYGFLDGNAYGTAPNQVLFTTGDRCLTGTCSPLSAATAANWPDVPFDLNCASGTACGPKAPSFWSTVRLTTIETRQYDTAAAQYRPVDSIALTQTLPATGDTTPATLWLSGITRTAQDVTGGGSTTPITLPTVTFAGQAYPNRVDDPNDGLVPFTRYRISGVTTQTGATFGVSYTPISDCTWPVATAPSANGSRCFPVKWTPPGYSTPQNDWFHKYAVAAVSQSDNTGGVTSERLLTSYTYTGPAWHYDDNEVVKAADRTWGQWRGYQKVQVRTGQVGQPQTLAETVYYQGMHGDTLPSGTRSVTLTDSQGGAHVDDPRFAGQPLESTTYLGDGGPVESSTISSYWVSAPRATRSRTGLPALTATHTGTAETWSRQAVYSGASPTWRYTQTDRTFDPATGLPTFTYDHGDLSRTDQATCTSMTYAPANTALNIVGLVAETDVIAKPCGGVAPTTSAPTPAQVNALAAPTGVVRPDDVISNTRNFYDSPVLAQTWPQPATPTWPQAAPTRGDLSVVRAAAGYGAGAHSYQTTSATVHDSYGRPIESYDGRGGKLTTAYTMVGGLTTGTLATNVLGHTVSSTVRPARGLPVEGKDVNNVTTTTQYDPLGRVTGVWTANRPTSALATVKFTYALSQTAPSVVTSYKLTNEETYQVSYGIYDSLLRERQTQSPTPQGGRLLTNTFYDSHGWVVKRNSPYWDSSSTPNGTLVGFPDNQILSQQRYTFDGLGRAVVAVSQRAAVDVEKTTTVYGGDRVTAIPSTGGVVNASVTDALGRAVAIDQYTTAPAVAVPANTFSSRLTVTGGAKQTTQFTYNRLGRPHQKIDPAGNTWTTGYNLLGQVVSSTDPDSGILTSTYDLGGNLSSNTDARGATVSYAYDSFNRRTAQYDGPTSASPLLASWEYDGGPGGLPFAKGRLTSSTSYVYAGSTAYAYTTKTTTGFNVFGSRLDTTVVIPTNEGALGTTYKFTHKYNSTLGRQTYDLIPAGGGLPQENLAYSYTNMELLSGLGSQVAGYASGTGYDAYSRPTYVDITPTGNTGDLTFSYDDHTGALLNRTYANNTGIIDNAEYKYDLAGNLTQEKSTRNNSTTETQCYRYDGLARLSQAWTATDLCAADPSTNGGATVGNPLGAASTYWTTWTFDAVGDRTSQVQHGLSGAADTTTTYNYPTGGATTVRPHALTGTTTTGPGGTSSTSYGYDATGNTTSRTLPSGNQTLTWNTNGRLDTVTTTSGATKYVYDADGNQLIRRDPGKTTLYLPFQELVLDTATNAVTGTRFYALPAGGQAVRTGSGTNYRFELTDRHGTGTLSLNNTGQTPTWRQSTPYGEARGPQPPWTTQHGFLNKPVNSATGLTDIGARKYDASLGRFISVDPILDAGDPQSWTGYAYVNNNPTSASDPSGLIADYDNIGLEYSTSTLRNEAAAAVRYDDVVSGNNKERTKQPKIAGVIVPTFDELRKRIRGHNYNDGEYLRAVADWAKNMCGGGGFTGGPEDFCREVHDAGMLEVDREVLLSLIPGYGVYKCVTGDTSSCYTMWIDFVPFGKIAGKVGKKIDGFVGGAAKSAAETATESSVTRALASGFCNTSGHSFVSGTHVLMADGTTKPIEEIKVGDVVANSTPGSDNLEPHPVTALHVTDKDTNFITVTASTPEGPDDIVVTEHHLFFDPTTATWHRASDLTPGTTLQSPGADTKVLTARSHTMTTRTYDLTIDQVHTYYVLAGLSPVLVHNDKICGETALELGDWEHIQDSHRRGGKDVREGSGIFLGEDEEVRKRIIETIDRGYSRANTRDPITKKMRPGEVYEWDFGADVGVSGPQSGGRTLTSIRVVVHEGRVVTAFPF
ncbi:intein C-terminal splicing region/RHS repeat-associated core domain-containing protein [Actinokineospora diospyrosa]|uniref:Intein C-terminal splicing region/RHS repeat-associated core domain-containing protein n=1 Tax=Actinokineospora diospyrosa TaxID=103728 RepID=A0ABT1IF74_9PSEU|nr:intein C-terminal splicing region/RHS repeat-associated core domain-containing protein [Actinokineospora diospyrosa]